MSGVVDRWKDRLGQVLQAVYGSLSSVIVLLLWLYFSARVLLFGAELIAIRGEAPPSRQ